MNGKPLTLSPMEYKMLNLFRKNPKQVLTRGQLLEKLWDMSEKFVDEHTLTTTISRIRSKIESDGGTPYIKTIYGMGYQWTEAKQNEKHVKRLFRWICIGTLLSMVIITLTLFVITLEIAVLAAGGALILCALIWFFIYLHRLLQNGSPYLLLNLCQTPDNMIDGDKEPKRADDSETLFARISHRLTRLYQIMQENRRKVDEERRITSPCIRRLFIRYKTPVSNLKMVTDTLLTRSVSEAERTDFIRGIGHKRTSWIFSFSLLLRLHDWKPA